MCFSRSLEKQINIWLLPSFFQLSNLHFIARGNPKLNTVTYLTSTKRFLPKLKYAHERERFSHKIHISSVFPMVATYYEFLGKHLKPENTIWKA